MPRPWSAILLCLLALALASCSSNLNPRPGPAGAEAVDTAPEPPASVVQTSNGILPDQAPRSPLQAIDPAPAAETFAPPAPVSPAPMPWKDAPHVRTSLAPPPIAARAAVVIDEASGAVLYDKEAHVPLPPASLTKIATAILALERGDLDAWVDIDVDSSVMRGSTVMGLLPGDRFRLRDLLYGLMLPSGNDAALAIGRYLAGSDAAFVGQMNALLQRLGLHNSHFANPHGLGNRDHNVSAYDMAMLSRYAMTLPGFFELVNARSYTAHGSRTLSFGNINTFLGYFPGADGVKTGYTRTAGSTLAASAWRDGKRVFVVVLNSDTRNEDARRLLNWAYANYAWP